jgi:hypothetical protein
MVMSDSQSVQELLAKAENAAAAGDMASADELLRAVARIQEAGLGPAHPELANTLNNLAIVAERTGRPGDAEQYYRRAVAIASASLSADNPMVVASRQNLEEFCRAQGLPIDRPPVDRPAAPEPPPAPAVPQPQRTATAPPVTTPTPALRQSTTAPSASPSDSRPSNSFAKVVVAIVALVAAALFLMRPWSSRDTSAPASNAQPVVPQSAPAEAPKVQEQAQAEPATPAPAQPAAPAPAETKSPPRREANAPATASTPSASVGAAGSVTLVAAQLCRSLSTSGAWRCVPAGDSVAPGPVVLYTRVKSPRDTVVVHRWYRGRTLRRSVQLEIRASASEGYRTFSRQTVDRGGDWRIEVRSAAGDLLHEQHLAVR